MICNWIKKRKVKNTISKKIPNRLAFVVGHTDERPGAFSPAIQLNEYKYWRGFYVNNIHKQYEGVQTEAFLRDEDGIAGAYQRALNWGAAVIIELHFNAYDGTASGCEVLLNPTKDEDGVREREFAMLLVNAMQYVLQNRMRGLKTVASKGERGSFNLMQSTGVPTVIIEPFFGDNNDDAKNAVVNETGLANAIVGTFKRFQGMEF